MAKRRFIAPLRGDVGAEVFAHPIYANFAACRDWFAAPEWPAIETLNATLPLADKRFATQDQALLDDGLHYEVRIGERGEIATRAENWHDLFNAAVWCRYPALKQAFNLRQCAHIAAMGPSERNRPQYALTQFDEAGAIVRVRDPALLALWDEHDWRGLFHTHAQAWRDGAIGIAALVGHALLEHALVPELYPVAKCVVVACNAAAGDVLPVDRDENSVAVVAQAIAAGELLNDPQELRPLPLWGIPGWHPRQDEDFYLSAGCFQPKRAGRVYPAPLRGGTPASPIPASPISL
jgi:Protein of unknown function (DUF3025)